MRELSEADSPAMCWDLFWVDSILMHWGALQG